MRAPPLAPDEKSRLEELSQTGLLYSPSEERFDRITRLSQRVFGVPIALVSLVSKKAQWFKSSQGLAARETSRDISFCGHAILRDNVFVVNDAKAHPDFADNPLVTGPPHIRFYAGLPLKRWTKNIGTLCVIDRKPRDFTIGDRDALRSLGKWVEREIEFNELSDAQLELVHDLTPEQRAELLDPLTGTWNSRGFEAVMQHEAGRPAVRGRPCAVLWIGAQGVEEDSSVAEEIIKETAQRIRACARPKDVVATFGRGEFALYLADCRPEHGAMVAERITEMARRQSLRVGDATVELSVGVGLAHAKYLTQIGQKILFKNAKDALAQAMRREPGAVVTAAPEEKS